VALISASFDGLQRLIRKNFSAVIIALQ